MKTTEIENAGKRMKEACIKTAEAFNKLSEALNQLDSKEFLTKPKSIFHK